MYSLPYFKEKDAAVVLEFMKKHPFITLTGSDLEGNPVATHVPVLFRSKGDSIVLRGHMMKNTTHHKAFVNNPKVLAIFNGPNTYVSASWYTDPLQGSTWNYMTVHAHGRLNFLDEASLVEVLNETTALFENDPESPALFPKIPDEYVQRMIKAIVAFEIEITEMDNVFKLSQNRDEKSFNKIVERLQQGDHDSKEIAVEMLARVSQLYNTAK